MFRRIIMLAIASMLAASFGTAQAQLPVNARPDNTGLNARANSANSKDDLELVARVRRAIEKDKSLSTMAHNIKIVSNNGQVTLRGLVESDQEKVRVRQDVEAAAGADNVDCQLDVVGQQVDLVGQQAGER
jgi:hyperosmotically inducible periplasmic protein